MADIRPIKPFPTVPAETDPRLRERSASTIEEKEPRAERRQNPSQSDPLVGAAKILEAHINTIMGTNVRLSIEKNEEADRVVYKAINETTGEVIKQFPPEGLLKLIAYYRQIEGLAVDDKI